jgi:hypothetical protein
MLMHKSGLMRSLVLALAVAALPILAGCSSNPFTPPPDDGGGLPTNTPLNDTPQNTMLRFEATYERQVLPEYEKLFASNFIFTFSNQSDPELAAEYGTSWGKDDEVESTSHLFDGFTSTEPPYAFQGPAAAIALSLDGASFIDDPAYPDSTEFYKWVIVPSVNLTITIAGGEEFQISAPHDFYLVRGDVALLDAGQEARADRWYIHRWDDKSAPLARTPGPALLTEGDRPIHSWGNLKATYVTTPR